MEVLFKKWVDLGMVIRLDIFHWLHRFQTAIRTESHPKYGLFVSCLSGAVLAYNKEDMDRVIAAKRAGDPGRFKKVSDEQMLRTYISKETLKHYVRRVTLGSQETFLRVDRLINELKGPAGLDEVGISLFKTSGMFHFI